jgi:hypothetical protein
MLTYAELLDAAREADLAGTSKALQEELQMLFEDELNPVAPKAQGKV